MQRKTNLATHRKRAQYERKSQFALYGMAIFAILILATFFAVDPLGLYRENKSQLPDGTVGSTASSGGERSDPPIDASPAQQSTEKSAESEGRPAPASTALSSSSSLKHDVDANGGKPQSHPTDQHPVDVAEAGSHQTIDFGNQEMSANDQEKFARLMQFAREQIHSRNFKQANSAIDRVQQLPLSEKRLAQSERLLLFSDYVDEFWTAFTESYSDLEGVELTIGEEAAYVVTANAATLIIRAKGKNHEYAIDRIPPKLVVLIADRRFNQQAASTKVFKGAYMATEPEFGIEKARQLWREASNSGAEIDDLELVLDDDYSF